MPPENAFAELFDRISTSGTSTLTLEAVEETLRRFRVPSGKARDGLMKVYLAVLRHAVQDAEITDEEAARLSHLQRVFCLNSLDVHQAIENVGGGVYKRELQSALSDGGLSPEEVGRLEQLAKKLRLPESTVGEIRKEAIGPLMQRALDAAIGDRRLSREEDAHLETLARSLGATITQDEQTKRVLDKYRLLWRIDQGELPTLDVPINLQRAEVCHAFASASLREPRSVTKAIRYSGPQARIRLARGLYWNIGRVQLARESTEEWRTLDTGTLYITSKRLLFDGTNKSTTTQLRRVMNFAVFSDGLRIEKDSGRDQLYLTPTADGEVIGATLGAALGRLT